MNNITKMWAVGAKKLIEDAEFPEYTKTKPTNQDYVEFGECMDQVGNDKDYTEWISQGPTGTGCRMWYRVWFALNGHKDFISYLKLNDERVDEIVEAFAKVWSQRAKLVKINVHNAEYNSHLAGIRNTLSRIKGEK